MEAAVALGVVSSIISIAQLTAKLTITTAKLINSAGDSIPENEWIEEVAQSNHDLAADLDEASNAAGPLSKTDSAVAKLARRCLDESTALIAMLEKLKVPLRSDGTKSKLGAAKAALKTMLRKGDLEKSHEKLVSLKRQLAALLLHAIRTSLLQGFEELRDLVQRNGRDCVAVVRDSHTLIVERLAALGRSIRSVGKGVSKLKEVTGRIEEGVIEANKSIGMVKQRQLNDIEQKRVEDLRQSLSYSGMDSRKDMIVDPVGSSYDWAFKGDKTATEKWLDSSVQHCWISGEQATGKSVFTKSFRLDGRTAMALQTQAGNSNLLILDHYFWIAGDSDQRSLRTMLQHLCVQALHQYYALAEIAFPDEWTSRMSLRGMSWTAKTLLAALKRIITATGFQTHIIIDGLDECEDKQRPELIQMLLDLAKTTSVRLCVSSRPWSDFEKAFDNWPRLKLPENNAWDIFQLICRRLKQADGPMFRDFWDDLKLFDITCAGRDPRLQWTVDYGVKRDSLNPPQRLIHDLCVKTDGNLLWVTCVLDTISQRLADGQSVAEVMQYIVNLPRDLEDYYYDLVYSRIHSTYRTGSASECAMALKILSCVDELFTPQEVRFELIRALQASIGTGRGIAHDPEFFAKLSSPETSRPVDEQGYQSVCAFVNSRCKDLMITAKARREEQIEGHTEGRIHYQHRVIYDFLLSDRMQSLLNAALPEYFRRPGFTLYLGVLVAKQTHERRVHCAQPHLGRRIYTLDPTLILCYYLRMYLSDLQGPLDQRAVQTCEEITTDMIRRTADDKMDMLLILTLHLVRVQRFTPMSEIIRLGSEQSLDYTKLEYAKEEEPLQHRFWPDGRPSRIRRAVSMGDPHTGLAHPTPGQAAPSHLPCTETWWTFFLIRVAIIKLRDDVGPIWSRSRAAAAEAKLFLEAGASIEIEFCDAIGRCHGHVCVCPNPSTHSKLYECFESHPQTRHKHNWISAKTILSERLGIPEAELLQIEARNRSTRTVSRADLLELVRDTEAAWQRHVEACVREGLPILDDRGRYTRIAKTDNKMNESDGKTNVSDRELGGHDRESVGSDREMDRSIREIDGSDSGTNQSNREAGESDSDINNNDTEVA